MALGVTVHLSGSQFSQLKIGLDSSKAAFKFQSINYASVKLKILFF